MYKTWIVRTTWAAACVAMGLGRSARADVIPPIGLVPGSQYQILFVTDGAIAEISTDIAYYNPAAGVDRLTFSVLDVPDEPWFAVVSTPAGSPQLWSAGFSAASPETEISDVSRSVPQLTVWTGTGTGCTLPPGFPAGDAVVECGFTLSFFPWNDGWQSGLVFCNPGGPCVEPLALQPPLCPIQSFDSTVVSEPATLVLLGSALLGLGVVYLRRRAKA